MTVTQTQSEYRRHLDRWPVDSRVYLTLDLECDYGTALDANSYEAARRTADLAVLLERHGVALSCFLQTEILEEAPSAIDPLLDADVPVEFHAHSHTHPPRGEADIEFEVRESVRRVRDRFDRTPTGFRFPDGHAKPADYEVLADVEIPFNASLFPSWRPGRFDNTDESLYPFEHVGSGVIELPFSVYSERVRVPIALSYLKLLGRPFRWLAERRPPPVIVFDLHMHDLVVPDVYDDLAAPYRAVYARNGRSGFAVLDQFVESLQSRGYEFGTMTDLYEASRRRLDDD